MSQYDAITIVARLRAEAMKAGLREDELNLELTMHANMEIRGLIINATKQDPGPLGELLGMTVISRDASQIAVRCGGQVFRCESTGVGP